jgi:hypothetical protein
MPMTPKQHWKPTPDEHDYPAAQDYLSLLMPEDEAAAAVKALMNAPLLHRKAKDLLRAAALAVLPQTNVHVAKDLQKVSNGEMLSPVLLVRGDAFHAAALLVADGYHRICASYYLNEDEDIPCRLADRPVPPRAANP